MRANTRRAYEASIATAETVVALDGVRNQLRQEPEDADRVALERMVLARRRAIGDDIEPTAEERSRLDRFVWGPGEIRIIRRANPG